VSLRPAVPAPAVAASPHRPRQRARLAALGLTVLVSLSGCTIPGFPPGTASSSSSSSSSDGEGDGPAGTGESWFRYEQGERVEPASTAPRWPAPSTTTRAPTSPAGTTAPTASAAPECLKRLQWQTKPLRATGGAGQATVTWQHVDDPRVIEYKVAAVLQDRPGGDDPRPETWITVAKPTTGCQETTATVTGLVGGRHYVFWLDAVINAQPAGILEPMIGRSNAVLVQ
jgi:hypothetical protein